MVCVQLDRQQASIRERFGPKGVSEDQVLVAAEQRNAVNPLRHRGEAIIIDGASIRRPGDVRHVSLAAVMGEHRPVPGFRFHHGDLCIAVLDSVEGNQLSVGRGTGPEGDFWATQKRSRPVRGRRRGRQQQESCDGERRRPNRGRHKNPAPPARRPCEIWCASARGPALHYRAQRKRQIARRLKPAVRILVQTVVHHLPYTGRHGLRQLRQRLLEDRRHGFHRSLTLKCTAAAQ